MFFSIQKTPFWWITPFRQGNFNLVMLKRELMAPLLINDSTKNKRENFSFSVTFQINERSCQQSSSEDKMFAVSFYFKKWNMSRLVVKMLPYDMVTYAMHRMYAFTFLVISIFNNSYQLHTCNSTSHKKTDNIYVSPDEDHNKIPNGPYRIIGWLYLHEVKCILCQENVSIENENKVVKCHSCGGSSLIDSLHQTEMWSFIGEIDSVRINLVTSHDLITKSFLYKKKFEVDQFKFFFSTHEYKRTYDTLSGMIYDIALEAVDESVMVEPNDVN